MTSSSNVKARRSSFLPRGEMGRAELRVVWRKHTRNARLQQEKQPKAIGAPSSKEAKEQKQPKEKPT